MFKGTTWGSLFFFGPTDHLKKLAVKIAKAICK